MRFAFWRGWKSKVPMKAAATVAPPVVVAPAAALTAPAELGDIDLRAIWQALVRRRMWVIIPTALMATMQNAKNGLLAGQWKIIAVTAIASTLLAWFGAGLLTTMRNETLTRIFGFVLVVFGTRMLWQGRA